MSGFFQFILGFILGLILFSAGIAGGAYWFLTKAAVNPSKPVFEEEKTTATKTNSNSTSQNSATVNSASSDDTSSNSVANAQLEEQQEQLPDGAYLARVTWNTGLSLRANPSIDAERIGGVGYNWEIIILSVSEDQNWQKVRIPSSGQEGWVKSGNVEKIED